jgi:EAL domain-containing protein (putative c-di-GMP-specific phosphodiesterase class I)
MAQATGLMDALDRWVLDEALRQSRAWRDAGLDLRVAVNLCPRELDQPELIDVIDGCLSAHRIPADTLELELTEGSFVHPDLPATALFLEGVRRRRLALVVDDFGTGCSALSYLHRLPIAKIKLDRSFIAGIGDAGQDALIVGLIELGHRLGCRVTGEGVETAAQLRFLARAGCDEAQGYFLARPARAADLPAVVAELARRGPAALA